MSAHGATRQLQCNLIVFCRLLRRAGIGVHVGRMIDVTEALQHVNLSSRDEVYHTCRAPQGAIVGREVVRAKDRCAYIVYPDGIGRSKPTSAVIESKLGRGTARNWNTVLKLRALVEAGL